MPWLGPGLAVWFGSYTYTIEVILKLFHKGILLHNMHWKHFCWAIQPNLSSTAIR